ncbi:MAG: bifunctional DNA-formamidopyrimidine glycosylase/DNA-(apurinic or apyrimidinic site) lyase [Microbacteriaceae bacterium]|nr:bifunctional DNA-formamidopyrimidine glycosylase/DNA-(apurinic or apyrimidinic site) lyase [Microbacteriaceae bacterium]
MPELPEVEVVRRGLAAATTAARIRAVDVVDERALKRHPGDALDFVDALEGRALAAPSRRGKFLWLPLREPDGAARERALVAHLGMSGQLLVRPVGADDERHLCIRMRVDGPGGEHELRFVDQRRFGSLAVDALVPPVDADPAHPGERLPTQVRRIARDPLDPRFDDRAFRALLRGTDRGIKAVLLDQRAIAGIGNIYADEALWRTRLHWAQPARTVSTRKANELLAAVRDVFVQALAEGGTSFDDLYVNVNGESGYFERSLQAYGRAGEPCARCGRPLVREPFANRSSFRCPRCQRLRGR